MDDKILHVDVSNLSKVEAEQYVMKMEAMGSGFAGLTTENNCSTEVKIFSAFNPPPANVKYYICDDVVFFGHKEKLPNRFQRLMVRLLFGWRVEIL